MMNDLALRLGRPDLGRSRASKIVTTGRGETLASFSAQSAVGPARSRASIALDTGTVSMTMLGGLIVAVGVFYFWTRGHQG